MATSSDLVAYGIQNEASDLRIHVCVAARVLYLYHTPAAQRLLAASTYPRVPGYQIVDGRRVRTAEGYLVPPQDIPGILCFRLPGWIWTMHAIGRHDPPTRKGELAVQIVREALKAGRIPLPTTSEIITEEAAQIGGVDLVATTRMRIQVKCDYDGGYKNLGGTGHLYLQIAESNPTKSY